MSNLSKEDQLLSFIEKKKNYDNNIDIDSEKIFFFYIKALKNSISKTYTKLKKYEMIINCTEMIHTIFWIILGYSNNLKLTMFFCERAIILFIEYISLSNNLTKQEEINIQDVKLFIYKKTIGPLKLNSNEKLNNEIINLKIISKSIKYLFYKILFFNIDNDSLNNDTINIESIIENVSNLLTNITYKTSLSGNLNFIEKLLYLDDTTNIDNIYDKINNIKFRLEIYNYLLLNDTNKIDEKYNFYCTKIPLYNNKLIILDNKSKFSENKIFLDIIVENEFN